MYKLLTITAVLLAVSVSAFGQNFSLEARAGVGLNYSGLSSIGNSWLPNYHAELSAVRSFGRFDVEAGLLYEKRGTARRSDFYDIGDVNMNVWHSLGCSTGAGFNFWDRFRFGVRLEPTWVVADNFPIGEGGNTINYGISRRFDLSGAVSFRYQLNERSALQLAYRLDSFISPTEKVYIDRFEQEFDLRHQTQGFRLSYIHQLFRR